MEGLSAIEPAVPEDRLWSVDEVSYYLGVPVNTLYLWRTRVEDRLLAASDATCGTGQRTSRRGWRAWMGVRWPDARAQASDRGAWGHLLPRMGRQSHRIAVLPESPGAAWADRGHGCDTDGSKAQSTRRAETADGFWRLTSYPAQATFSDVAVDWLSHLDQLVAMGRRSPGTVALYRHALERHVLPGVGQLRLSDLAPARFDHFLHQKRREKGYSTAKLCRTIAHGVCGLAVRREALRTNPVRDVSTLEVDDGREARVRRTCTT